MRISNVNSLSALIDRLIVERIKQHLFNVNGDYDKSEHQRIIGDNIKNEIEEVFKSSEYKFIGEKRTFLVSELLRSVEDLVLNNVNIGNADRARLNQIESGELSIEKFVYNELLLRLSNEKRSFNKNQIDTTYETIRSN